MPGMQVLHCYHGLPLSQRGNVAATPGDRILPRIHLAIHLRRDTRVLGIASEPDQHRGCMCVRMWCGLRHNRCSDPGSQPLQCGKRLTGFGSSKYPDYQSDMLVKQNPHMTTKYGQRDIDTAMQLAASATTCRNSLPCHISRT